MASNVVRFYSDQQPVENRRAPRLPVLIARATVRQIGEKPVEAALHDLSIYGCRVASGVAHDAGDRLWLRFDGGSPVAATAIWSDGSFTGCRFDEPIAKPLFRALTQAGYGMMAAR